MLHRAVIPAALLASLAFAPRAHADASPQDRAAADALYEEAGKLAQANRWDEACAKLEASNQLDPAIGTLLRLGSCYEHLGKSASAWSSYNDAFALATKANDKRAAAAAEGAKRLEPTLARLLIDVAAESRAAGVEVRRDGTAIGAGALGTPVPVDPGTHAIEASAAGKQAWKTTISVAPGPGVTTVQVPALADLAAAPPSGGASPAPYWGTQRIAGVSVAGAGMVGVVIGAVFGARAISKMSLSNQTCHTTPAGDVCDGPGLAARQAAGTAATAADVGLGVGIAALAGGAALFFTAPAATKPQRGAVAPRISVGSVGAGGTGIVLKGVW